MSTSRTRDRRRQRNVGTRCTTRRSPKKPAPSLRGSDQLAWIERLVPEMGNLRAAQGWAIDHGELDLALAVIVPLCVSGTTIGLHRARVGERTRNRTRRRHAPAGPGAPRRRPRSTPSWAHASSGPPPLEARRYDAEAALGMEDNIAGFRASTALDLFSERPVECVDWGASLGRAGTHRRRPLRNGLGTHQPSRPEPSPPPASAPRARPCEECVAEARQLANPSSLATALAVLGLHLVELDPMQSIPIFEEAIQVGTTVGNHQAIRIAQAGLARAYDLLGNEQASLQAHLRAMNILPGAGHRHSLVAAFIGIASMLAEFRDATKTPRSSWVRPTPSSSHHSLG